MKQLDKQAIIDGLSIIHVHWKMKEKGEYNSNSHSALLFGGDGCEKP